MRVIRGIDHWDPSGPTHIAIGTFDGVHRGHQALLRGAVAAARVQGGLALALTFHPHPSTVLAPHRTPPLLTSLEDRLALFRWLGLDRVLVMPFDRPLASMEASTFARDILVARLGARTVFVGYNFRFGRGASGTAADLERWGAAWGMEVHVVPPVRTEGVVVSSSWIRERLSAGDVGLAASGLGRLYSVLGSVQRGEGRGAAIGFPTANLAVPPAMALPAGGVYAAWVAWKGRLWPAVANLGHRPTFGGGPLRLEVHVLGLDEDLYGQSLRVGFVHRLRSEQRFEGVQQLVQQIRRDVEAARSWLDRPPVGDPLLDPVEMAG